MDKILQILESLTPLFQVIVLLVQVGTLIAIIIYVWKTWEMARATSEAADASQKSLQELQRTREQQIQPYVICFFQHMVDDPSIYELVILNTGQSMAFDVTIVFSPPLQHFYQIANHTPLTSKEFKTLPPNSEWRTIFGSFIGLEKESVPDYYTADVCYTWGKDRKHEQYKFTFDLKSIMGKRYTKSTSTEDSLEKLVQIVERLERKLGK